VIKAPSQSTGGHELRRCQGFGSENARARHRGPRITREFRCAVCRGPGSRRSRSRQPAPRLRSRRARCQHGRGVCRSRAEHSRSVLRVRLASGSPPKDSVGLASSQAQRSALRRLSKRGLHGPGSIQSTRRGGGWLDRPKHPPSRDSTTRKRDYDRGRLGRNIAWITADT
jgi:hypothetical protein